jgi:hypothetical protein
MSTTESAATTDSTATAEKATKITVLQAVYGATSGGVNVTNDVTDIVRGFVARGKYSFIANNDVFGDPIRTGKHFAMSYMVGSSRFAFACEEDQQVTLRTEERRGPITVIGASYGTIDPGDPTRGARDVTAIVQDLLDRNGGKVVTFTPDNDLFGDPYNGPTKSFGMIYAPTANMGDTKAVALREGQEVTVRV